jgi:HSP90 family molecular chaperone
VIGSTGTGKAREELPAARAYELIGQFGIGMLSAFVIAEKVVVRTRKAGNAAFAWHNSGSVTCELYADGKDTIGTDVILHIGEAYRSMLDPGRIRAAVIRYCDFIQFPIKVDGSGLVNAVTPPWHRDSWQSHEEKISSYRQYLERRYPQDTIFAVIPVEIDGGCRAYGGQGQHPARQRPCLHPAPVRARRVGHRPSEDARQEPSGVAKICLWHHYHLKGMALEHDLFFDKIVDHLLFETNRGSISLEDYLPKNPSRPEDEGRAPLYYFGFAGAAAQFYRLANANDRCVINAGMDLDEEILYKYAQRNGHKVVPYRLDVNDDPDVFKPLDSDEEATFRQLEIDMEGALRRSGVTNIAVRMRRFAPTELPAVIILTEDTESDIKLRDLVDTTWLPRELEEVARQALDHTGHRPSYLQLNATNELVRELAGMSTEEPATRDLMYAMYTSAVLYARNLLTQQNSEAIHRQFLRLCARTIELVEAKQTIEEERRQTMAFRDQQAASRATRPDHVVLFMMTPFEGEYKGIENAVRQVFERAPYFFEVVLARDKTYKEVMRDNVREGMVRAHGFIAEISELNPNVMMELGAALFADDGRPTFVLRCEDSTKEIPADIKDLILAKRRGSSAARFWWS